MTKPDPTPAGPTDPLRLALRPREAAAAIGISPRKLWQMTASGEIPFTRMGRCVRYPADLLKAWLADRAEGGVR